MISEILCAVPGCGNKFKTGEPVSPRVRFICKHHPRSEQVAAAGREYNPETDNQDLKVHFQEHAFDKELDGSHSPSGTENDSYDAGAEANQE